MRHPRSSAHHATQAPETPLEEFTEATTGNVAHVAPEVVDVRVVDAVRVEEFPARSLIAYRNAVGVVAVQLAPELRTRAALHIRPTGGAIFIASSASVTTGTGYTVPDGQAVRIEATDSVYAIAAGNVDVSVMAEVREG